MKSRTLYLGTITLIHPRSGLSDLSVFQRKPSFDVEIKFNTHERHVPHAHHKVRFSRYSNSPCSHPDSSSASFKAKTNATIQQQQQLVVVVVVVSSGGGWQKVACVPLFFVKNGLLIFMTMSAYLIVYMGITCLQFLQRTKEDTRSPENGVMHEFCCRCLNITWVPFNNKKFL